MTVTRIALTPGEPAGIGPELAVQIAQHAQDYELVCIADSALIQQRAKMLGLSLNLVPFDPLRPRVSGVGEMSILHVPLGVESEPGKLDKSNALYVLNTLTHANNHCLSKSFAAIVTGPVQKSIINDAGIAFTGHTEFFAENSHTKKVVMMLATEGLRVALATTHLPLKDVAKAITHASLTDVLNILIHDLKSKFGIATPRILVCGLNPHAGEGGHMGTEEIDTITPVLESFRRNDAQLIGPLPADTLFSEKNLQNADAVLAMYHDQGLPVLKYKGFGNAVNITLGLPYIRTSVDHGTALDLAGKGTADTGSLEVALRYAYSMAKNATGSL